MQNTFFPSNGSELQSFISQNCTDCICEDNCNSMEELILSETPIQMYGNDCVEKQVSLNNDEQKLDELEEYLNQED